MRTSILAFLMMGLVADQAMAVPRGTKFATLQVVNRCDEAVQVTVEFRGTIVLEPNASAGYFFSWKGNLSPTVTASLVADPSVSDSETCRLGDDKTTIATIDCSTTGSGTSLDVNCLKPGTTLAFVEREVSVTLASTGGLGFLLLLGTLLGRGPRRQTFVQKISLEGGETDGRPAVFALRKPSLVIAPLMLVMALTARPAMAISPGGGPKPKFQSGDISVTNNCDAAVRVDIGSFTAILEPNESAQTSISLGNDSRRDVNVTASLVSNPTVTSTQSCIVQKNKLTLATVTCSTTVSGVTLDVVCDRRTNLASLLASRDADVALASTGGLGLLLAFGVFLGRGPRRREPPASIEDSDSSPSELPQAAP